MNHIVESQDEVFAFLSSPATHGGRPVHRIDTHAAAVFLAGDRALKVKRAVRFPFLDYSTRDKREAMCRAELEVNHPFAPGIYRRVVPITREADGRLAIDGKGEPVEWAVEMNRFDEEAILSSLAEHGGIDAALADRLGRAVAAAHAAAPAVDAEAWIAALASYVEDNDAEFRARPLLFPPEETERLTQASRAGFARVRPMLAERGQRGLIRRCHGDLHLGNIVLIDGEPVLFDAIEFSPVIAAGDVLYDLAFLLMDLIERGLAEAANIVLNRYLTDSRRVDDLDALAALPLFLSVRAAIRAKVTAARLESAAEPQSPAIEQAARTYFRLACALIAPPPPRLIAIGGLSGTGKSVLARALAPLLPPAPGAVWLRSDVERKALFGLGETERLPATAYTPEIGLEVYAMLAAKARRAVTAGHSAIIDAVYAQPAERSALASMARECGVPLTGLFLTADLATRVLRVGGRAGDASDADAAVAREQEAYDLGALDWTPIDAGGSPADTLRRAQAALGMS